MGYIAHNTIVVTGSGENVEGAYQKALALFTNVGCAPVSPLMHSFVNDYLSFCVFPDGSKEGWDHSAAGDRARAALVEYLKTTHLDWVEVRFGGDDPEPALYGATVVPNADIGVPPTVAAVLVAGRRFNFAE